MKKIGLSSYSISRAIAAGEFDILGAVDWIAENGGEHIEIVPSGCFKLQSAADPLAAAIRKRAGEKGIEISSYTIGANLITAGEDGHDSTAEECAAEIERLKREVDIAAALGVRFMRHDAGWRPMDRCGIEQFERDLPKAADACGQIADYAARYGITTSVENHGYFFQGSERVHRLVAMVGRDNFRTTLDVGNFNCVDEDSVSATMNNISIASMIHFKDFYIRDEVPTMGGWFKSLHGRCLRGAITGCGDLNLRKVTEIIRNSSYDGFISVEYEGMEECKLGSKISLENVKALFA